MHIILIISLLIISGCTTTSTTIKPSTTQCTPIYISKEILTTEPLVTPLTKEQYLQLKDIEKVGYLTSYLMDTMGKYKICKDKLHAVEEILNNYNSILLEKK